MDPLSHVFQFLSARSYMTSGQSAGLCWAMRYPGFAGMKLIALRKGTLWFRLEVDDHWHSLSAGDSLILTRKAPFILATDTDIKPVPAEGKPYTIREGLADYGGNESILLAGKMEIDNFSASQLLASLPTLILVNNGSDASSVLNWLMTRLHDENQSCRPGASITAEHLMQLVMLESVRSWILSPEVRPDGWMGALRDPRIMRVISALQDRPEKSWGVLELAGLANMSRATFARRFRECTGTTPLSYLTEWRMQLASRALRSSNETVKHLAWRLGYASESAFSSAFSRFYSISPTGHRRAHSSGPLLRLESYQKS